MRLFAVKEWVDKQLKRSHAPPPTRAADVALGAALLLGGALLLLWLARQLRDMLYGVPVTEHTEQKKVNSEGLKPIPKEAQQGDTPAQLLSDGTGPLFHRRYCVDIAHPTVDAEALIAQVTCEINDFCPSAMATFDKTKGVTQAMQVGDEYYIHIAGPWDGPVRVIDVQPTSFAFVTIEGHMEAGEIRFRLRPHPTRADALRFEILSWARSRDMLVDLAYDKLKIAKQAQTNMWVHFCKRVAEESGGELIGEVDVLTEEQSYHGEDIPIE